MRPIHETLLEIALKKILKENNANKVRHSKGTLFDHLVRVSNKLKEWEAPSHVVIAGLCHSVYSTEYFKEKIFQDESFFQNLLDEKTKNLIKIFSEVERDSISYDSLTETGTYINRFNGENNFLGKEELQDLIHIVIANELDHLNVGNFTDVEKNLKYILTKAPIALNKKAESEIFSILKIEKKNNPLEKITYLGHAGVWLKTRKKSLVIDPWFFSSTIKEPVLFGLKPSQRTIDFAIPKPENSIKEILPDTLLLSHFHTHHSPLKEIKYFAKNNIKIICPKLNTVELKTIENILGKEIFNKIDFCFIEKDTVIDIDGIHIECFFHTTPNHLGFMVKSETLQFLHISDSVANKDKKLLSLDKEWDKLEKYKNINHLFISAANHSQLIIESGLREIREHASLSPVQASYLVKKIKPQSVSLIGMNNFSIWDSGIEYTESPEDISRQFLWAMRFLSPPTEIKMMLPGDFLSADDYIL